MLLNIQNPIILFDGVCNVCDASVKFILARDKSEKYLFASLQSDTGQELLKKFGLPTEKFKTFALVENKQIFTKSTAALKVAKELSGVWKFFYVFIYLPVPVRDFFYDLVSKNRYLIGGKKHSCMIPTPEIKKRFL